MNNINFKRNYWLLVIMLLTLSDLYSQELNQYFVNSGDLRGAIFEKVDNSRWKTTKGLKMDLEVISNSNRFEILLRQVNTNNYFKLTNNVFYFYVSEYYWNTNGITIIGEGEWGSVLPHEIRATATKIRYGDSVYLSLPRDNYLSSGDEWVWSDLICDSFPCNNLSSGISLKVKPQVTTTYYLTTRKSRKYIDINIYVDTSPEKPLRITGPDFACDGKPVRLEMIGGHLGKNNQWTWYEGTELKMIATGKEKSLKVIPKESTVYFLAVTYNGIPVTELVSHKLRVDKKSIPPDSIIHPSAVCANETILLTLQGGKLAEGEKWKWNVNGQVRETASNVLNFNSNYFEGKSSINVQVYSENQCFKADVKQCTIRVKDDGVVYSKLRISQEKFNDRTVLLVPIINNNPVLKPYGSQVEYRWKRKNIEISTDALVFVKYKPGREYYLTIKTECTTLAVSHEISKVRKVKEVRPKVRNKFYREVDLFQVEIGTGINNKLGYSGIGVDYNLTNRIAFGAGMGLSTWGMHKDNNVYAFKEYSEMKLFIQRNHNGMAFGLGTTYNNGRKGVEAPYATGLGFNEWVKIDFLPQWNVFSSVYYYFDGGYLSIGYSYRMYDRTIVQVSGNKILQSEVDSINSDVPGGFIVSTAWVIESTDYR